MNIYLTGEEIKQGDIVKYGDMAGTVNHVVFPEKGEDRDWSIPGGGVVFTVDSGDMFALTWEQVRDPNDPVEFVRRP